MPELDPTPLAAGRTLRPRALRARLVVAAIGLAALITVLASARAARTDLGARPPAPGDLLGDERPAVYDPAWSIMAEPIARTGYRRGRRQAIQVVPLGPDRVEVEVQTARAFLAMRRAAAEDGVELRLESGFRTREEQAELYRAWRRGRGHKAARPGRSNHQSGRALDIAVNSVPGARAWLEANAARFGFKRTVRSEPWHWEYVEVPRARVAKRYARKGTGKGKAAARTSKAAARKGKAARAGNAKAARAGNAKAARAEGGKAARAGKGKRKAAARSSTAKRRTRTASR